MAESSNRDDWRRKHSLLALWQEATALKLRDTSLLSIAVDDCDREDAPDLASLHRMARFCREAEPAVRNDGADAAESIQPELLSEPVEAASAPEPLGDALLPNSPAGSQPPADPPQYPWPPAPTSATHREPSVPMSQIDEISESLREVRNELKLLRERRTRRYF